MLHTEHSGYLSGTPIPLENGLSPGWEEFRFKSASAELNLRLRTGKHFQWELWHIRSSATEKVKFSCEGFPVVIIGTFLNSAYWSVSPIGKKLLHDRSINGIIGPFTQQIHLRKNQAICAALIRCKGELLQRSWPGKAITPERFCLSQSLIADSQIIKCLTGECGQSNTKGDQFEFETERLLNWLIVPHSRRSYQPKTITLEEAEWFYVEKQRLQQYIHFHLPYGELLALAGIHQPDRFKKRLRQLYGMGLGEFITEARISESLRLLSQNDHPIKKIAQLTGFPNVHYFTRVFTKTMGIAPGTYLQQKGL